MNGLQKNAKTSIFGHFRPKWPILDSFWTQWAKREFFQKIALNIFPQLQALTNYNVSEKVMNGFRETASQTDGRMNG